jgi:DNA-binding IscR family transcriptional regulator
MATAAVPTEWKFLTNHGLALLCIAADPGVRLRDIAERLDITERATHRIVSSLVDSGYVERNRNGRRNVYEIKPELPLHLPVARDIQLGDLLTILEHPVTTSAPA